VTWQLIISATAILIGENIVNVYIDAYKIKQALGRKVPVAVKHGINFAAYGVTTGACIYFFHMPLWFAIEYAASAFFCRQIFFDIPLNWRRGLKWDYVSLDNPPKALMDRIEVRLFGFNGKAPTICYGILWVLLFTAQFFI
jgi:hypothetical protein